MSLFSIVRYTGEEDSTTDPTSLFSDKNLRELQQRAKEIKLYNDAPPTKKRKKSSKLFKNKTKNGTKKDIKNGDEKNKLSQKSTEFDLNFLNLSSEEKQLCGDETAIDINNKLILCEENDKTIKTVDNKIGNFSVLGTKEDYVVKKVSRKLPDWLANPFLIENVVSGTTYPIVEEISNIEPILLKNLKSMNVTSLFPVQRCVIPAILKGVRLGFGVCKFPPRDICVSAPTGSGKTIAFALPIVQALINRVKPVTRALIVLPTRELATQIFRVFVHLCNCTSLRCVLLTGAKTTLEQEQNLLAKTFENGEKVQADIVIATPGRLVEHLNETVEFNLDQLRFLVIDEADRMMDQVKQDWLNVLERTVYKSRPHIKQLTIRSLQTPRVPLQKLLFSATLSADPEQLEQLNLFQPQMFTALSKPKLLAQDTDKKLEIETELEFIGKYTTPLGLKEFMVVCTSGEKPMAVLSLVKNLKKVLCFAGSVETTQRLALLLQLYMNKIDEKDRLICSEFSSQLSSVKRRKTLKDFTVGKINVLVCSDAMARGIDVPDVTDVILYDAPSLIKTYIHRVGRTARAGDPGNSYTLLKADEVYHFKKMLKESGKNGIKKKRIPVKEYETIVPLYEQVLPLIADKLKEIKR